ncbi:MAG: DUF6958 family protein [Cypionkella sp.]
MKAKITVENIGQPGKTYQVDSEKYAEMRRHMISILPDCADGLANGMTVAQVNDAVRPRLSQTLFPNGQTCGWWVKCVQLDLEAKGIIQRAAKPPVRLCKAPNP